LIVKEVEGPDADTVTDTITTYDRLGRVLTSTTHGAITSHVYDRAGNEVSVTDPAGIVTTTTYDPLGRATVVITNDVASPSGPVEDITTTTFYDAAGNTIAARDARGVTTRSIVNVRDQVSRSIANCTDSGTTPTTNPAGCTGAGTHTTTANVISDTVYDGQGAAVRTVTAVGLAGFEATTETAYDAAGRVQASKDAMGTISRLPVPVILGRRHYQALLGRHPLTCRGAKALHTGVPCPGTSLRSWVR
jgi:YD repeat-containing protein